MKRGGYVPDSAKYNSMYRGNWNSCNMLFVGMGQGEVNLTPIQLANAMCIIANKGYYYTPHLVKSIGGNTRDTILKKYHTFLRLPSYAVYVQSRRYRNLLKLPSGWRRGLRWYGCSQYACRSYNIRPNRGTQTMEK